jgi:glycosyltransferase involved in cell wall biosynthesis
MGSAVNTDIYSNTNRKIAKMVFSIDEMKKVIFVGSENLKDKRKGWNYVSDSISLLYNDLQEDERKNVIILLTSRNINQTNYIKEIPFQTRCIDYITDNRYLSLVYQATDIFLCPSMEDLGPIMVAQALACGTPVVGFKMGLLFDDYLVKNYFNGFIADLKDSKSLSHGMQYFLRLSHEEFQRASKNARNTIVTKSSKSFLISVIENL